MRTAWPELSRQARAERPFPGGSELWFDPRRGSEKAFLKALGDLASKSNHPELERVPWFLWGHSGGGIWSDVLSTMHPEARRRHVAAIRLGGAEFRSHPEFVRPEVPAACYAIPIMLNPGVKEEKKFSQNPKGLERGPWWGNLATFREYREHGPWSASRPIRAPTTSAATLATSPFPTWTRAWRNDCRKKEVSTKRSSR